MKLNKIILALFAICLMATIVSATVSNEAPNTNDMTNAATYDFSVDTSLSPAVSVSLIIGGSLAGQKFNVSGTILFDDVLLPVDDGNYSFRMQDYNGIVTTQTSIHYILVDRTNPIAGNFRFQATDYNVSYVVNCTDSGSGIATELAQYNFNGTGWQNMNASPQTFVDAGSYQFRGYCMDNVGNEKYTAITTFGLPATPPDIISIKTIPGNVEICTTENPCDYALDGNGQPLNAAFKLTFDKDASITVTMDGGTPIGPSGYNDIHVVSLNFLTEGNHSLVIDSVDVSNQSSTHTFNLYVSNTSTSGTTEIQVQGSIPIPPTPAIQFLGSPAVLKNDVFPGDFAIVKYNLTMTGGEYTRFSFIGDPDFVANVTIFCEENYDPALKDIIDPLDANVFNIETLDGALNETKNAITCPYTSGSVNTSLSYHVIVKYPISETAQLGSTLHGTLGVGLYDAATMP